MTLYVCFVKGALITKRMLLTLKSNIKGCSSFCSLFSSTNVSGDLGLGVVDLELGLLLGVLGDKSEQRNDEGVMGDKGGRRGVFNILDSVELMVELLLDKPFLSILFLC